MFLVEDIVVLVLQVEVMQTTQELEDTRLRNISSYVTTMGAEVIPGINVIELLVILQTLNLKGVHANQVAATNEPGQEIRPNYNSYAGSVTSSPNGAFFTKDQYYQILQLLSKPGGESGSESSVNIATAAADTGSFPTALSCNYGSRKRVIDNGVSHHITSNIDVLDKAKEASDYVTNKVHLPNGKAVSVSHIGNTRMFKDQSISNFPSPS